MNPNLNESQVRKGWPDTSHSVIESRRFIDMIDAAELLKQVGAWRDSDSAAMKEWIGQFEHWLLTSKAAQGDAKSKNNHGNWYDVQAATFALYIGDVATARKILEHDRDKRIAEQIEPDGRQPLELARTRAFWYSEFNLNAWRGWPSWAGGRKRAWICGIIKPRMGGRFARRSIG